MRIVPSILVLLVACVTAAGAQQFAVDHVRDAGHIVRFADAHTGFTFGRDRILRTTDGGATWQLLITSTLSELGFLDVFDAWFANASTGWMITGKINLDSTFVCKTTDGGRTWRRQLASPVSATRWASHHFARLSFVDAEHGWVIGKGLIRHTTDGGESWTTQLEWPEKPENNDYLRAAYFLDRNEGWVAGYGGLILHTTNGGGSWEIQREDTTAVNGIIQRVDYYYITDIRFVDRKVGFAAANNGHFLYTNDGGATWQERSTGSLHNNESIGIGANGVILMGGGGYCDDKGCYVGQSLLSSADGGVTWMPWIEVLSAQPEKSLFNRIEFPTPEVGYASTSSGHLFRIRDLANVSSVDRENGAAAQLSAAPNPARDMVSITVAEPAAGDMSLYDMLGRLVLRQPVAGAPNIILSLAGVAPGAYILEAPTARGIARERVVVR